MRVSSMQRTRRECDGCGAQAPGPDPAGWFERALDLPYYTGLRCLLFCPRCFPTLAADQRPRWRRLGEARLQLRTEEARRRAEAARADLEAARSRLAEARAAVAAAFAFVDGHVQRLRFPGGRWADGGPWVVPDMSMYSRTGRWETRPVR